MFKPLNFFYNWYRQALRHPKSRWWVIGGSILWLFNPLNAIPIIGQIDDAIVLTMLVTEIVQLVLENMKNKNAVGQKETIAT